MNFRVPTKTVISGVEFLAFLIAAGCIAAHAPGQASMDTSVQLYEAMTGESVSWNPPFMSALMSWMGGGEIAMAGIVFLNTVLVYGSYIVFLRSASMIKLQQGEGRVPVWSAIAVWILILNPIVMIYVGIVWKDVLFAALLTAGASIGMAASLGSLARKWFFAVMSVFLLAAAFQARQQGVFMAPILLLIPAFALCSGLSKRLKIFSFLCLVCIFIISIGLLRLASNSTIHGNEGRSSSVGFRSIIIFDAMGMVSNSNLSAKEYAYPITEAQLVATRTVYNPGRIDYIDKSEVAGAWLGAASASELNRAWLALVQQNPAAYAQHRIDVYTSLLGLGDFGETLPVHVGIDGNKEYLNAIGVHQGSNQRSLRIYRFASQFFNWPIYRQIFWLVAAIVCTFLVFYRKSDSYLNLVAKILCVSVIVLYASFIPTAISSDFRYLFSGIPLVTLITMLLLFGIPSMSDRRSQKESF